MGEEQRTQHVLADWSSEDSMGETAFQPVALNPNIYRGYPLSVLTIHGSNCKNSLSITIVYTIVYLQNALDTVLEEH